MIPWGMWLLGALFYCYAFFQRVAPAVMVDSMMAEFQVGAAIAGMLSGLYFYTYAPMQVPIGLLLDRYGPRRMLTLFAAISCVGSALFATADSVTAAYVGRGLVGIGAAVTWVGTLKLASLWFPPSRFAMITGMTLAMGMAGAVGAQAPLAEAVQAVGWRGTMWAATLGAAVLAVVLGLCVRDGRPEQQSHVTTHGHGPSLAEGLRRVLSIPQIWLVGLYSLTMAAPMLAFAGLWGVPYLMQVEGLSRAEAAFTTSAMLVSWGIGSPLTGWISDRMGKRKPALVAAAGSALVLTLAALYLPGLPLLARQAMLCLMGAASSGFVLSFATGRENVPTWASGAALGVVNTASMTSGAVFQPLIGWILDLKWDGMMEAGGRVYSADAWGLALATLPACQALALVASVLIRETHCRHPDA
jgi:MFS family permease